MMSHALECGIERAAGHVAMRLVPAEQGKGPASKSDRKHSLCIKRDLHVTNRHERSFQRKAWWGVSFKYVQPQLPHFTSACE